LYENTYSGAYTVMPMALGATKVVVADDTDAEKIKGAGLWYQWGRKDPLGRASAWNNNGTVPVTVLPNTLSDENLKAGFNNSASFFMHTGDGANNRISLISEMLQAGYTSTSTATDLEVNEVEKTINGQPVMVSADRHIINKTINNPTMGVYVSGRFSNNWLAFNNNNLWGNPEGYTYPHQSQTYKSVFDPCPNGYRLTPRDIWLNFLVNPAETINKFYFNVKGGGANDSSFNKGWTFYYKGMGTVTLDEDGITAIGYTEPENGLTDFYAVTGYRSSSLLNITNIGTGLYIWHSGANAGGNVSIPFFSNNTISTEYGGNKGAALPVRCVKEE
ncbi:MAG: hypothetical protein NC250_03215, partial [Alistipes senegalensis]|nr:hypothetical protein [Bacteroides cellulosilyticus]MCM1351726.1 hypothetical protein [Alistipes senegalensis]